MKSSTPTLLVLAACVALTGGCKKKKKPEPPPQAQAPTITQPVPAQTPPQATTPPTTTSPETTTASANPPQNTLPKKPAPKHHPRPKKVEPEKPAPTTEAKNTPPPRITIDNGAVPPATGVDIDGHNDEAHAHESTDQLLDSTDKNLKSITRALSADEQQTVARIRSYMDEARKAVKDGDLVRAHNLALKAHLLSDALVNAH
jgi:hypothetical protein